MATVVTMGTTILTAIEKIKSEGERSIYVVDNSNILVGVVSQGDLLRLNSSEGLIESIMQLNPIYVQEEDLHTAIKLMKENKVFEIPVVAENYKLLKSISIWKVI